MNDLAMLTGCLAILGCSHHTAAQTTTAPTPSVLQLGTPCSTLVAARTNTAPQRLFLEISDLTQLEAKQRDLLLQHQPVPVTHAAVANGLLTDSQRGSVPFICSQRGSGPPDCQLALTPELPDGAGGPIRLRDVRLQTVDGRSDAPSQQLDVHDQQTVTVTLRSDSGAPFDVAITPYLIDSERDLSKLLSCKRDALAKRNEL